MAGCDVSCAFQLANVQASPTIHRMNLPSFTSITDSVLADIERRCAAINTPVSAVLDDAGVDWSTWWRWRQGKSSPTLGTLSRVTRALDARETTAAPKAA